MHACGLPFQLRLVVSLTRQAFQDVASSADASHADVAACSPAYPTSGLMLRVRAVPAILRQPAPGGGVAGSQLPAQGAFAAEGGSSVYSSLLHPLEAAEFHLRMGEWDGCGP